MEIAQEVAQPPPRRGEKTIQGALNQFVFVFCFQKLQLCANVMCDSYVLYYVQKVMCKRIDYELN